MKNVIYPATQHRLVWYLSVEDYLATQPDEYLMLWQTKPTVIIGLHQDLQAEVNMPWCEAHGVEIYRRKSGGGCVYSDAGNLMVSYIRRGDKTDAQSVFQEYLNRMAGVLVSFGLPAVRTANNDILVDGRKVSGNACHVVESRITKDSSGNTCIERNEKNSAVVVHGTLLLDSNIDNVNAAITPSAEKLRKHAVASVRQRVANLSELGITDTESVKQRITSTLSDGAYTLTDADINAINAVESTYLAPSFIYG